MARKYDLISELYNRTCKSVVSSPMNWQAFLSSACRNYKLRFDEQLLVFAQRPDATAVLEIERWNGTFGRWVNKGATGIAVFDDVSRSRQRLIHYFDISDTHESRYSRPVPIWSMKPEYEEEIIETLEGTFGELKDKSDLASAILSAAQNAAEDNAPDYTRDLMYYTNDSLLADFNEENVSYLFKKLVANSVAFMIMERLDLDAGSYFEWEDLADVVAFSTPETLNSLGFATSDIAEMGLAEIAKTVMSLEKQNRIIAGNQKSDYNKDKETTPERSFENERTDLHNAGRLQTAQPDLAGAAGSADGTLLPTESGLPEGASQGAVLQPADELQAKRASERGGTDGDRDARTLAEGNGGERGRHGEAEGDGSNGLGTQDEQHPQPSAGDGVEASSLRLDYYDRRFEDKSLPFFGGDDTIREILATTPHLKATKDEIRAYLESEPDEDKRTEFIKGIFNNDYTEVILSDERRVGYKSYQNVLHLWAGRYPDRTEQGFYDWGVIAQHFEAMRLLGELQDKMQPLPSMDGQMSLMLDYEAEVTKPSAFSFSQEIIDAILCKGSQVSEGKFRIYEQYQKSLSHKENIDFLKNEYGWGGSMPVISGTGINEQHDGKGMEISKRVKGEEIKVLLKWNEVEKRIGELIKMDRYLNPKEKEYYPEWLTQQEIRRAEAAEERRKREILSTAPAEKEQEQPSDAAYEYHLGDTVYIGSNEYEILSFDDERVMLFDVQFPLFNKEMNRAEFDEKVRENPMNDHLKVKEEVPELEQVSVYDRETEILYDVLFALKIDDVELNFDDDGLVATDGYSTWHGMEFYEFLVEDAFVFEDDGSVLGISDDLLKDFTGLSEHNGVPVKDNRVKQPYRDYLKVKADNPDSLVFFQVGDFFEAFNDDAKTVAEALDLMLTSRPITDSDRVPMVGLPKHRLETYMTMLTDRGYDIAVASLENGERKVYNLASQNKEDPVESKPIGRIEYLHTDGRVRESIEYTGPYQFVKDIKEENQYGVPLNIVFYADNAGRTIERDFLTSLDPPAQGVEVILSPYIEKPLAARLVDFFKDYDHYDYMDSLEVGDTDEDAIERVKNELGSQAAVNSLIEGLTEIISDEDISDELRTEAVSLINELKAMSQEPPMLVIAKQLIDDYCREEFEKEEGADYSDLSKVGVAYTTTEDDRHEIQANVNLVDFQIETLVDGKVIRGEQFSTLEDMIERGLKNLSFNDLVYLSDEELERVEQSSTPVTPAWEQPKKSKVQSFDLHPEIPMADRHNFDLPNHEIEEVGKKERFRRNMEAIRVLKECEFENRFATPDEQIVLSKYVGWGGIPEAFDENNSAWSNEFVELYTALSLDEYTAARESTLTAFYTPPTVIQAVYKAMEQMWFREGNILEPSCGIGHFIGMMPDSMSESKIYGVELDSISAGIAQQLYQKTSIAVQPFEEANLPDSFFDAVVCNVPFGDFKVPDKRYDKHKFLIHDYFFAKSLDKLRPGGVMALITSKGTMDKENTAVRKYIAQRADLLGAIRLPNDTFKGNAGTEVVSDILILQKRDRLIDIEPEWVHLGQDENGNVMNSYFVDHPEMILGEMKTVSGRFGPELSCLPYEGADLAEQLNEAISNIHGEISAYEVDDELTEEDNSIPADPTVRNFSYTVVDDTIYFRENSRMAPVDVSATAESRIKGMIAIRDSVRNLIELQTEDYSDSEIKAEQERLNSLYDTFTSKYGLLNNRANTSAFSQDSSFSLLSALEILDDEGNLERKADMFSKRTIKPHTPVTSVDTSSEALAVSMGEKACIDMDYMMQLSGKTEEEIYQDLKGVIFLNPMYGYGNSTEAKYLMADEYLSGNVREKLAWARRSAELYPDDYTINVEAIERVQPKDLTASEISVRLGATWLPPEIVEKFIFEFLGTPRYAQWNIRLHFSEFTGEWNLEGKSNDRGNVKAYSTYGTSRINAYKIIEETLNLKDVRIFDYVEDENGKKKAILNKKETAIAQAKQELIKQGFQDWIWSDPQRRERLTKLYNEKFNSIRPREYDGSHITFNGMNPEIELREHQRNAVAHILYGGNTLLAHAVGAGKTFEMTAAAMEAKRLGLCSKSLFVVPNHLTEQWAS